jgi:hypothetical protein
LIALTYCQLNTIHVVGLEDVFYPLTITPYCVMGFILKAVEERLIGVVQSLSKICNNHVEYFTSSARVKLRTNQTAEQLGVLKALELNVAAEGAGAVDGAVGGGGGGGGEKRKKTSEPEEDDWGLATAQPPRRRKTITAGDFAVWSAQNRQPGRQFKALYEWHLKSSDK